MEVEKAAIGAATCRLVSPTALDVPINEPLSAYDPRTYPISSVHWWFGDGAPNLQRQRPMLFEEVARRLIDVEEMEYMLPRDETPYEARSPSRFTDPEVLAMLGDAVRRLKMLQGVRATIQRRGFWQDLKSIAEATVDETSPWGRHQHEQACLQKCGRRFTPCSSAVPMCPARKAESNPCGMRCMPRTSCSAQRLSSPPRTMLPHTPR